MKTQEQLSEEMLKSFLDFLKKENPDSEFYAVHKESTKVLKGQKENK
jgi:hypothetical protein